MAEFFDVAEHSTLRLSLTGGDAGYAGVTITRDSGLVDEQRWPTAAPLALFLHERGSYFVTVRWDEPERVAERWLNFTVLGPARFEFVERANPNGNTAWLFVREERSYAAGLGTEDNREPLDRAREGIEKDKDPPRMRFFDTGVGGGSGAGETARMESFHELAGEAAKPDVAQPKRAIPRRRARKRYANAKLMTRDRKQRLENKPLEPGAIIALRLSIGPLARDSIVERPQPLNLPRLDQFTLDVVVSSTHFKVGESPTAIPGKKILTGLFFVNSINASALTPTGKKYIDCFLLAPMKEGRARARVTYYYNNTPIQSQLLEADVGRSPTGAKGRKPIQMRTDFTLSESFTGLEAIRKQSRTSILVNDNGDGRHQVVVRRSGSTGAPVGNPGTLEVREASWGRKLADLRVALRDRAPRTIRRRRQELIDDLWSLAIPASELLGTLPLAVSKVLDTPFIAPDDHTIQVTRPDSSTFTFPWSLMYEIPLDSDAARNRRLTLCTMVEQWNDKAPLFSGTPRACPNGPHKENVLCPFGFWGFRYSLEQLTRTDEFAREIKAPADTLFVTGETLNEVDRKELDVHIDTQLTNRLRASFPRATIARSTSKANVKQLIGRDLPFVYFYCHGDRLRPQDPDTYLGLGTNEPLTAGDFRSWVTSWRRADKRIVWDQLRPLIFVNACHSLEIRPESLVSYLDAFIDTGRAAAVIGTEVRVNQLLAMEFAQRFFDLMLPAAGRPSRGLDASLRETRLSFLREGNLLGLSYTSHGFADLMVVT